MGRPNRLVPLGKKSVVSAAAMAVAVDLAVALGLLVLVLITARVERFRGLLHSGFLYTLMLYCFHCIYAFFLFILPRFNFE